MKITVLGQWGAYPEKNEATAGYLVQSKNTNILLDCGSSVLSKLQNYINVEELHGVVLSHYHGDHFADIECLQHATKILDVFGKLKKPLNIYGLDLEPYFSTLTYSNTCIGNKVDSKSKIIIGDFEITFSDNIHTMPCLATRVNERNRSIVFSGDTEWNDSLIKLSKNVDLLICESSLYNENKGAVKGHLTAGEVGEIASKANVKSLMLTHFPHYGELQRLEEQAREKYDGEIIMAAYGKVIEI